LQIEYDMVQGATLEGFRRLLLLVLLQDAHLMQPGPLAPSSLLSLEELLLSRTPETQQEMLLTTCVNLMRIINSSAADIQGNLALLKLRSTGGLQNSDAPCLPLPARVSVFCHCAAVVRELSALMLVVQQWPQRREACMAQATAAAGGGGGGRHGSVEQDAAAQDEAHATQLLAWLSDHTNMEARVVEQLVSLKLRISAATGSGIFSGVQRRAGKGRVETLELLKHTHTQLSRHLHNPWPAAGAAAGRRAALCRRVPGAAAGGSGPNGLAAAAAGGRGAVAR
jgi:hypothetical protein